MFKVGNKKYKCWLNFCLNVYFGISAAVFEFKQLKIEIVERKEIETNC